MANKKFRAGGLLGGQTFSINKGRLKFQGPYGKHFVVVISQIDTVTVDSARRGRGLLKIIGHGTILASIELPFPWAEKAQDWILDNLDI